ncbi:MAG: hypothetical protein IK053_02070 [Muribaculaceae bacterium]|nr:hypothetical protein [Muribaculaceae bacterium]
MIDICILGGESDVAGEIIRILINHPDVELKWIVSEKLAGSKVADFHAGLIGEIDSVFVDEYDLDDVDCVFLCTKDIAADKLAEREGLKVIDVVGALGGRATLGERMVIPGIAELYRKPMVRGGSVVALTSPATQAVLLPLLPLAKNGLLSAPVKTTIRSKADSIADTALINSSLRLLQPDFSQPININMSADGATSRVLTATVEIASDIDEEKAEELFEDFFGDHNFVFLSKRMPAVHDVVNTNKCIFNINASNGILTMTLAFDEVIKGGAGSAVHAMNLLFGLHERVGLALKAFI